MMSMSGVGGSVEGAGEEQVVTRVRGDPDLRLFRLRSRWRRREVCGHCAVSAVSAPRLGTRKVVSGSRQQRGPVQCLVTGYLITAAAPCPPAPPRTPSLYRNLRMLSRWRQSCRARGRVTTSLCICITVCVGSADRAWPQSEHY